MTDFAQELHTQRIEQARSVAVFYHGDQKYGDKPYVYHLEAVRTIVEGLEDDPFDFAATQRSIVALLHDTIEDTEATFGDLERLFGLHVARQVFCVSDEAGKNRRERKLATNRKLKGLHVPDYDALIVKAADRLANIRAASRDNPGLLKMYRKEHRDFRAAAYRPCGIAAPLWTEMDRLLG